MPGPEPPIRVPVFFFLSGKLRNCKFIYAFFLTFP